MGLVKAPERFVLDTMFGMLLAVRAVPLDVLRNFHTGKEIGFIYKAIETISGVSGAKKPPVSCNFRYKRRTISPGIFQVQQHLYTL